MGFKCKNEAMIEYVRLYQDREIQQQYRLQLLLEQRQSLLEQKEKDETLDRLNYKISIYEDAVKTGKVYGKSKMYCKLITG